MPVLIKVYDRVIHWAEHKFAVYYLALLSFAEASFFPIPTDVMLAPMVLARLDKAWWFAFISTVFSVLGGIAGYFIGVYAFDFIEPYIHQFGYWEKFELTQQWFVKDGVWVIFIAGFSPIPFKVFTIAAGVIGMAFIPFTIAAFIGRGARYFLVAGLIKWGGKRMENVLKKYMDVIGIIVLVIIVIFYFLFRS
ncbi:MAG: YqaA family protein [Gammaproteobacteria bacterium]